jgi:hypothetical protein
VKILGHNVVERWLLDGHDGRSGARLERVRLDDGQTLVVKTSEPGADLTVRLTGGVQRERRLWAAGTLGRLPPGVGHPILTVFDDGAATVTVMRDLGDAVPGWTRVLDTGECGRMLGALNAMHATFLDDPPPGLCPLETRLTMLSPQVMGGVAAEHPLAALVVRGWEHFDELVAPDVAAAVAAVHADPAALATAMREAPTTLLHADLWLVNLALVEHEVAFLDWALATEGPPALDLAVFLTGSSAHVQPSREELIDAFVAGSPTTSERAMDLALLAGLADLGWNKALDAAEHSDAEMREHARADLEWWVRRGSLGLEWL